MILVSGATGRVGRALVEILLARGQAVRALTRQPQVGALPGQVEVYQGDLADAGTLVSALRGVDRLFLFPVSDDIDDVLSLARSAGVRSVVLLSSLSVVEDEPSASGEYHRTCEDAVRASGLTYTFIRPGAFMANDLRWAPEIRADRTVRMAYPDSLTAPVDELDVAAVAASHLLRDKGPGAVEHPLTGPEPLSQRQRAVMIGEALGVEVRVVELTPEQAREHYRTYLPADAADLVLHMQATAPFPAVVAPAGRDVLSRPPMRFTDWLSRNLSAFQ